MNLHSVAEQFKISRPAISKHIKILSECGMVVVHRKGREKLCEANLGNLHKVDEWMEKVRGFWGARLDALGEFLNHPVAHANPKKRKK
jgi:DNA-binding transcriptional ArsR family regulator